MPEEQPVTGQKWVSIVYDQGEMADEVLKKMLRHDGQVTYQGVTQESIDEALDYLKEWDYGEESEHTTYEGISWGSSDATEEVGEYVIAYNLHFGYVSLNRKVRAK